MSSPVKKRFSAELAFLFGVVLLAVGTALMERAAFGVSMVVAPAYLLHLRLAPVFPFFSFGMAEYTLQAVLLLLMIAVIRRFRVSYLFSFVTAVTYGFLLDAAMLPLAQIPTESIAVRLLLFVPGMLACSMGVSLLFHTYIAPAVYELFVKEVSARYGFAIHKCKTLYDCCSCLVSILLSFSFFGLWQFEGIGWGTVVCALLNGFFISRFSAIWERHFTFVDTLPFRSAFEK